VETAREIAAFGRPLSPVEKLLNIYYATRPNEVNTKWWSKYGKGNKKIFMSDGREVDVTELFRTT